MTRIRVEVDRLAASSPPVRVFRRIASAFPFPGLVAKAGSLSAGNWHAGDLGTDGYFVVLVAIGVICATLYVHFRRMKWL
ncbi:hypothetical protein [Sphingomonas sp. 66-10]|uniref:hypothetical protein n=1 Tax=Sphingomonas sp. 66-10 TaxID=1895848 RepID=UPI00257F812D|nr:hypothetical protein [Sphingomonas sp. 66-10]